MKNNLLAGLAAFSLLMFSACSRTQPVQQAEQQPIVQQQPVPAPAPLPTPAPAQLVAFEQALAQHPNKLVLVDFTATWCGPCKMMKPHIVRIEQENAAKLHVLEVDVDQQRDVAQHFGVSAMPTLALFRNGQYVQHQVGYQDYAKLKAWVSPLLAQ